MCAAFLTLVFFLVLPLIQAIGKPAEPDMIVSSTDVAMLPPPDITEPEPEPEPEPEEEPPPPELSEEPPSIDLAQLELALNPGPGDGWMTGDFSLQLSTLTASGSESEDLFSGDELDQKARVIYQASPSPDSKLNRKAPGTVWIVFDVDERGRVKNPKVQKSTDSIFEKSALNAIKKWRFEPAKRKGKPVRSRKRVPITYQKN